MHSAEILIRRRRSGTATLTGYIILTPQYRLEIQKIQVSRGFSSSRMESLERILRKSEGQESDCPK